MVNQATEKYKFENVVHSEDILKIGGDSQVLIKPIYSIVGPSIFYKFERI